MIVVGSTMLLDGKDRVVITHLCDNTYAARVRWASGEEAVLDADRLQVVPEDQPETETRTLLARGTHVRCVYGEGVIIAAWMAMAVPMYRVSWEGGSGTIEGTELEVISEPETLVPVVSRRTANLIREFRGSIEALRGRHIRVTTLYSRLLQWFAAPESRSGSYQKETEEDIAELRELLS